MCDEERIKKLRNAFATDGFSVGEGDVFKYRGKIGLRAHHNTAVNYQTKNPKKAFYLEGTPYEMGYLMGLMAEPDIERMSVKYVEFFPFALLSVSVLPGPLEKIIHRFFNCLFKFWIKKIKKDIPQEYKDEMQGMLAGCKEANSNSKVREEDLWTLNVGIDAIFAHFFTGKILGLQHSLSKRFKIPNCCNAFFISGEASQGKRPLFGRDFMFTTAGVFQDYACLVIYNPDNSESAESGAKRRPIVSQTAPGAIGSITCVNDQGVAAGVNVSPSAACNAWRPGFNSLLLVRHCIQLAKNADEVVDVIADAPRGVSWLYPIADSSGKAGIVEAHCKIKMNLDQLVKYLLSFLPSRYKKHLPDKQFIKDNLLKYNDKDRELLCKGLMVRWNNYAYPGSYLDFNLGLKEAYNSNVWTLHKVEYPPDAFTVRGYIDRYYTETDCPSAFYFAPQREKREDVLLATNQFIIPEMRLPAMYKWTTLIAGGIDTLKDAQWRYDTLNDLILGQLEKGPIDYNNAKDLIDFLSPKQNKYPCYYDRYQRSEDCKEIAIDGSVSLFDLENKTIESHFGYFCDEWVKITLPNYI